VGWACAAQTRFCRGSWTARRHPGGWSCRHVLEP
jgi:hypothetical protein